MSPNKYKGRRTFRELAEHYKDDGRFANFTVAEHYKDDGRFANWQRSLAQEHYDDVGRKKQMNHPRPQLLNGNGATFGEKICVGAM